MIIKINFEIDFPDTVINPLQSGPEIRIKYANYFQVIKFLNANSLIEWLAHKFSGLAPIIKKVIDENTK
jgi:hypothetical protein